MIISGLRKDLFGLKKNVIRKLKNISQDINLKKEVEVLI